MNEIDKEREELKRRLKELTKKKYKRFNTLLKVEVFKKLEKQAEKEGKSKAKMLGKMINKY